MLAKLARLYYTLSPLKLIQFWGLFYYRVLRRFFPFKAIFPSATKLVQQDAEFHRYQKSSWLGGKTFEFLNQKAEVDLYWQAPEQSMLWLYNLHYFDDLFALGSERDAVEQADLIKAWWQVHAPIQGIAWDPYPTSLRAVNLCKWHWANNSDYSLITEQKLSQLLARHYLELKRKLEYQIQANHLFTNLKALWFLQAAMPEYLQRESTWLQKNLAKELALQFDKSGGHFELSPMYHRIMLWDILDMLAVAQGIEVYSTSEDLLRKAAKKALVWVQALSHTDQEVAFFNDASMGIAPTMELLLNYASNLDLPISQPQYGIYSGYVVHTADDIKLFCDVAIVGPAFQPGHAHADTLSFELSIGMQRLFVNSGTSEYGEGAERLRQRSTAAHNTVEYDGKNSSDVWSGFRVGKSAAIVDHSIDQTDTYLKLEAAHNGYSAAMHTRRWICENSVLTITDTMKCEGQKTSRFYLHPNIEVEVVDEVKVLLTWREGQAVFESDSASIRVESSTWHPEFGKAVNNKVLVLRWQNAQSQVTLTW